VLLLTSFINSVYYVNLNQERCWGQESLLAAINRLPEGSRIGLDRDFTYLGLARNHDILDLREMGINDVEKLDQILGEERVDYMVLSLYMEAHRQERKDMYPVSYMMVELPFKRSYNRQQLIPGLVFESELYQEMQEKAIVIETIKKDRDEIFKIYKI